MSVPVRIMIGTWVVCGSRLSSRVALRPSIPGREKSITMTSGVLGTMLAIAALASTAVTTSNPPYSRNHA